jgi:uncharacterized membrane protein YgdD (TMEM256/DUF423 family)
MYRTALVLGILFAGLGIVIGAFGAHALKPHLSESQLQVFETGVRYQMYHSFALLAAGMLYLAFPARPIKLATSFFLIGILLFSGSLYAMTLLKINGQVGLGGLGILTPIGGLFFILGWLMLLIGVLRKRQ